MGSLMQLPPCHTFNRTNVRPSLKFYFFFGRLFFLDFSKLNFSRRSRARARAFARATIFICTAVEKSFQEKEILWSFGCCLQRMHGGTASAALKSKWKKKEKLLHAQDFAFVRTKIKRTQRFLHFIDSEMAMNGRIRDESEKPSAKYV